MDARKLGKTDVAARVVGIDTSPDSLTLARHPARPGSRVPPTRSGGEHVVGAKAHGTRPAQ